MYLDQMGVPLQADWAANAGTLTISHREEEAEFSGFSGGSASDRRSNFSRSSSSGNSRRQQEASGGSGSSSRRSGEFQRGGRCNNEGTAGGSGDQAEGAGALDLGSPDFKLDVWLQSLQRLRNTEKLAQVELPLKVRRERNELNGRGSGA